MEKVSDRSLVLKAKTCIGLNFLEANAKETGNMQLNRLAFLVAFVLVQALAQTHDATTEDLTTTEEVTTSFDVTESTNEPTTTQQEEHLTTERRETEKSTTQQEEYPTTQATDATTTLEPTTQRRETGETTTQRDEDFTTTTTTETDVSTTETEETSDTTEDSESSENSKDSDSSEDSESSEDSDSSEDSESSEDSDSSEDSESSGDSEDSDDSKSTDESSEEELDSKCVAKIQKLMSMVEGFFEPHIKNLERCASWVKRDISHCTTNMRNKIRAFNHNMARMMCSAAEWTSTTAANARHNVKKAMEELCNDMQAMIHTIVNIIDGGCRASSFGIRIMIEPLLFPYRVINNMIEGFAFAFTNSIAIFTRF